MSMDPNMIAQMLMQQGQAGGPVTPVSSGAALLQKIMMIKALQNQQQQPGQPPAAQPNILGQVAAQPQVMQAQQLPGGTNA